MDRNDAKQIVNALSTKQFICGKDFIEVDGGYIISTKENFELLRNMESDKPLPHWIPCSERRPNPDCTEWRVGVTTSGKAIAFKECQAYESDTGVWMVPTYLAHGNRITHWMPLPKPPKED